MRAPPWLCCIAGSDGVTRRVKWGAAAVVLVAWFLRVWQLGSIPPGLHHDEAIEGLNALDVLAGHFRFWFPAGGGREPLFMYLAAGVVAVLGPTAFALRLLAAAGATLAVAASFALGRRLFDGPVALVAAGLMATSYWQVHTGRLGLRSALLPPLAALSIALLLRGVDRGRPALGAAGGAALGLTVYTYFAARLLPVVALPLAAVEGRRAWRAGRRSAAGAALAFALAAAVVAAPMALYVLIAPSRANERVSEASVFAQADPGAALRESVLGALGMFFVRGDAMWKYNFDARPIFAPPLAALFGVGLVLCLVGLRRRGSGVTWLWLVVMALPTALATESPHFIRNGGLGPVVFLPPALAALWIWRRLPQRAARFAPIAVALLVGATGAQTYQDYFLVWARSPVTGPAFAYDVASAAAELRRLRPIEPIYLSVDPYEPRQLVAQFLASSVLKPDQLHWFDGRRGLVLPPEPAVVVFPSSARPPEGLVESVGGQLLGREDLVDVFRIAAPSPGGVSLRFGDAVDLLRADPPAPARGDESLTPLLIFRLTRRLTDDLTLFAQIDGDGGGWGSRDDRFYLTSNRQAGESIVAPFTVPLDPGTPTGEYRLRVGIYGRDGARLKLADGRDSVVLGPVHVAAAGRAWRGPPPLGSERATQVGSGLRLAGATADPRDLRPGDQVIARTYWQRDGAVDDCRLGLELRAGSQTLAASQVALGAGRPPGDWAPGELVQQRLTLTVPASAPSGPAELALDACGAPPLPLGQLRIAAVERRRDRPTPPHPLSATFGPSVKLIGYGIEGDWRPGARLKLTLYWEALGATDRRMTVFAHLLDATEKVRGQRDNQPLDGARPTTGWQAGEFLVDPYELRIASDAVPGEYALEIGLYDATDGQRVPIVDVGGRAVGDRLILERRRLG